MSWYTWIDDTKIGTATNVLAVDAVEDDQQRINGFQPGTPASAKRVNTILRQSSLITVALMNALSLDLPEYDFTNSVSTIVAGIAGTNLFKLSEAFQANSASTLLLKTLLPTTGANLGSNSSRFTGYFLTINTDYVSSSLIPTAGLILNLGSPNYHWNNAYINEQFVYGYVHTNFTPAEANTYNLGSATRAWANAYATRLTLPDGTFSSGQALTALTGAAFFGDDFALFDCDTSATLGIVGRAVDEGASTKQTTLRFYASITGNTISNTYGEITYNNSQDRFEFSKKIAIPDGIVICRKALTTTEVVLDTNGSYADYTYTFDHSILNKTLTFVFYNRRLFTVHMLANATLTIDIHGAELGYDTSIEPAVIGPKQILVSCSNQNPTKLVIHMPQYFKFQPYQTGNQRMILQNWQLSITAIYEDTFE